MKTRHSRLLLAIVPIFALILLPACQEKTDGPLADDLSDEALENLVSRSYQYVAMYNVNNKFAMGQGGWNTCRADTQLKDHTMTDIARPNNDTFYISALMDLRGDALILEFPAFDSEYVSLMVTGYDHYVSIPMASRLGDFRNPARLLVYSERTQGYGGEPVEGVDRVLEATGDFLSAVLRVMPHANEPERLARIIEQANSVRLYSLSEFLGTDPKPVEEVAFPPVAETDLDTFGSNLLEVMQFVFNHTTFDPNDPNDQEVLAAYRPLGLEPGKTFDPATVSDIDGERIREAATKIRQGWLERLANPSTMTELTSRIFQPKGDTDLEAVLAVSIIGPIGLPQEEAIYPQVATADGEPANALYDYVIRMGKDDLPPAKAFWSLTLYDRERGLFIPNDRKKYSVGLNAGMKLDEDGGIAIHVAAEQPEGVPEENWLPIERKDEPLSFQLRIYVPDLEAMKAWEAPVAERQGAL